MDIQIDLAVSLTKLVCALQGIWGRNKRKEKCYQIWGAFLRLLRPLVIRSLLVEGSYCATLLLK